MRHLADGIGDPALVTASWTRRRSRGVRVRPCRATTGCSIVIRRSVAGGSTQDDGDAVSHYYRLSQIGSSYSAEEGTSPHREDFLNSLASQYRTAVMQLKVARENAAKPADYGVAAGTPGRVKAQAAKLANLEATQAATKTALNQAIDKVARAERYLKRMGATLISNPDDPKFGQIDWGFTTQTVVYDKQLEAQGKTRLRFSGGRLFLDDAFREPFDTRPMVTANMGPGYAIYVMSQTGSIHVSSHSVGHRHHSSLLAGQNVAGAGEMQVWNGTLKWISNKSGHYFPEIEHLMQTLHSLTKKGVPLDNVRLSFLFKGSPAKGQPYASVQAFMNAKLGTVVEDLEYDKLVRYLMLLPIADFMRLAADKGWRWVTNAEINAGQRGVKTLAGDSVPHRDVRKWLKENYIQPAKSFRPAPKVITR